MPFQDKCLSVKYAAFRCSQLKNSIFFFKKSPHNWWNWIFFFWSENLASTKKWKIPCIFSLPTMLQKLSKCEVKAWLCWNLIILPPLRFYVKSNFGELKRSKNVIFGNFRDSELWNLLNLGLESCSNWLKSKFRTSKIAKNEIFGPFQFTKIGFHVK